MTQFILEQWWLLAAMVLSLLPLIRLFVKNGTMSTLESLDRRWIFLIMFWAVLVPIYYIGLTGETFPEVPSALAQATFDEIESLDEGAPIMLAFDYDPASEGELGPMATSFVRHAAEKRLKLYMIALWPVGPQMIDDAIGNVLTSDFPDMVYGEDFVNLGFKSGNEAVIKVIVTNLRALYTTDSRGTAISQIPMMEGIDNIQQMDLIVNISAGYPGAKEWVQYAVTPYPDRIRLVAGATGVQAPLLYPYIPEQLPGLLGAIKGAAEYESLVNSAYSGADPDPKYLEALRRMGPQLVAHLLVIALIIVANILFFINRRRETRG
jgi:hypothetical protein